MNPLIFNLMTTTPMFMAGSDGKSFELRPPSVKGLMRFWWRACYWGESTASVKHGKLEETEGKIFGTTTHKSPFSIRLKYHHMEKPTKDSFPPHPIQVISRGRSFKINILEYLAYGTYECQRRRGNVFAREYLSEGQRFSVMINIPRNILNYDCIVKEVVKSFYFFSVFGGFGAKSRNGFGSFVVMNPEVFDEHGLEYPPFSNPDFFKCVMKNTIPNYTAFSSQMKVFKLKESYSRWDDCLARLGVIYRESRSNLERKHEYQKRQYIGAPIVAGKSCKSFLERRSKPYFMRVTKEEDNFRGYISYLPSMYCDGEERDRNMTPIIHEEVNRDFQQVCGQFNKYLGSRTEVII